jgi:hypothetical protein
MPLKCGAPLVHLDMGGNMIAHAANIGLLVATGCKRGRLDWNILIAAERDCNRGLLLQIPVNQHLIETMPWWRDRATGEHVRVGTDVNITGLLDDVINKCLRDICGQNLDDVPIGC